MPEWLFRCCDVLPTAASACRYFSGIEENQPSGTTLPRPDICATDPDLGQTLTYAL